MTDKAMGNIIIVVAVLLNHILSRPVASINPSTIRSPLVPVSRTMFNAILRCRFHFSIARPNINPPMNKKITGCAYGLAASSSLDIPSKGNKTSGSNATTGIGTASVTHQVTINAAMANVFAALASSAKGLKKNKARENTIPATSERNLNCCLDKQLIFFKIRSCE